MNLDRFVNTAFHISEVAQLAQRSARLITDTIWPTRIIIGLLVAIPSLSTAMAQVIKPAGDFDVSLAISDTTVDPLQRLSASIEALSKRVSPGVVQIFSTGYNLDRDRPRTTEPMSRGSSLGSGIIVASDGWIVTNAHVVQGARRIRHKSAFPED